MEEEEKEAGVTYYGICVYFFSWGDDYAKRGNGMASKGDEPNCGEKNERSESARCVCVFHRRLKQQAQKDRGGPTEWGHAAPSSKKLNRKDGGGSAERCGTEETKRVI